MKKKKKEKRKNILVKYVGKENNFYQKNNIINEKYRIMFQTYVYISGMFYQIKFLYSFLHNL